MSATLQQELASLLVRRTEEGRTTARRHIEAWQSAIAAVQKAAKMAECEINVPTEQINGVQGAAAQIGSANYIQAIYLENKATTERNALIATASRALQEKIEECQRTEATAKQEILRAETVAKEEVQRAITKRDNVAGTVGNWTIPQAKKERDSGLRVLDEVVLPTLAANTKHYFFGHDLPDAHFQGVGIAILGVVVCIGLVKDYTVSSLIMVGFLGYLAPIGLLAIRSLKAKAAYKATKRSKVNTVKATFDQKVEAAQQEANAAEQELRKVTEASEKQLREVRSGCENTMKRAEVHRKKAEDALRWFQAQV